MECGGPAPCASVGALLSSEELCRRFFLSQTQQFPAFLLLLSACASPGALQQQECGKCQHVLQEEHRS